MRKRILCLSLCTTLFSSSFCDEITFINSDNTRYAKDEVHCEGNVIVAYSGRIISANKLSYDKKKEIIRADGNVIIKDERQNIYFLDSLWVSKDFSSGEGKNVKIIMVDRSRLAANKCSLKNGKWELRNVVYTPCYECSDSGELTWQVKALNVIFDPEECSEYQNAQFELFGTPIFYTPYFSHISAKVKRKSGFLVSKFATSNRSGFSVLPQYLWAISDSQELILKPIITSKIGSVGWAYYGLRFPNGEFSIDASITGVKSAKGQIGNNDYENKAIKKIEKSSYRGHLFSKLKYEINETWKFGFDINLASDYYYLKKFPFFENVDRTLESNVKLEGFDGRNYTSIKAAMFQSEFSEYIPHVFPMVERNYSMDLLSGTFSLDSYIMNLDFHNNRSAQKFTSNASWEKEMPFPCGHIFALKGILSFKGLKVSEREESDYDSQFSVMPQLNLSWKWPLVLSSDFMNTIFTPIIGVIVSSNRKKMDVFEEPFCEINDVNFLDGNKSISPYNIDAGDRVYYGFKLAGYKNGDNLYRFTIGRSTELTSPQDRLESTGLKYKNSNIVTSLDVFLSNEWTFIANGSYSSQSKRWDKIETGLNFSNEKVCFDLMLFKGKQYFYNPFDPRLKDVSEEKKTQKYKGIMFDVGWYATRRVKLKSCVVLGNDDDIFARERRPSRGNCRLIRHSVGIEYKNECTTVDFAIERKNYRGGDLKPETIFRLAVHLKNLGI